MTELKLVEDGKPGSVDGGVGVPKITKPIPPRPTAKDLEFFSRLALKVVDPIMEAIGAAWDEAQKAKAVKVLGAVLAASEDGYTRAHMLHTSYGWEAVNEKCVSVLRGTYVGYDATLEEMETEWVMAHGIRFPAFEGDRISFRTSPSHPVLTGVVAGIFRPRASGLVTWTPTSGTPVIYRVMAEQVSGVVSKEGKRLFPADLLHVRVSSGEIIPKPLPPQAALSSG